MRRAERAPREPSPAEIGKPATVMQCHAVIDTLAQQVVVLQEQVALLQERLKLDSHNSSKPPSSDGPGRPNRAQRRASERGAQKGHPGTFRALLPEAEINGVHDCQPERLCVCGAEVGVRGKAVV